MQDERKARPRRRDERPASRGGPGVPPIGSPVLPSWESFPVADRHQLVRAILRAARRQVRGGPLGGAPGA
jgi:hypothetical protein